MESSAGCDPVPFTLPTDNVIPRANGAKGVSEGKRAVLRTVPYVQVRTLVYYFNVEYTVPYVQYVPVAIISI